MFELYRDAERQWHWRLLAPNGAVLAQSAESSVKRSTMLRSIDRLKAIAPGAGVSEKIA